MLVSAERRQELCNHNWVCNEIFSELIWKNDILKVPIICESCGKKGFQIWAYRYITDDKGDRIE